MARVIGQAGYGAKRNGIIDLSAWAIGLLFLLVVVAVLAQIFVPRIGWVIWLAEIVIGTLISRNSAMEMWGFLRSGRSWLRGGEGESRTGAELARLNDKYLVFHDFHLPKVDGGSQDWNLDHVVIGPNGVFVVETKNYSRRTVSPSERDAYTRKNVAQARANATTLKEWLRKWSNDELKDVFVEAIVVYAQDDAWVEKTREGWTNVLPLRLLAKEILGRPKQDITPDQKFRIADTLHAHLELWQQVAAKGEWNLVRADRGRLHDAERVARIAEKDGRAGTPQQCPHCGAPLTRRVARFGVRRGKPFLGCSQYGKTCHKRFGFDLNESA